MLNPPTQAKPSFSLKQYVKEHPVKTAVWIGLGVLGLAALAFGVAATGGFILLPVGIGVGVGVGVGYGTLVGGAVSTVGAITTVGGVTVTAAAVGAPFLFSI